MANLINFYITIPYILCSNITLYYNILCSELYNFNIFCAVKIKNYSIFALNYNHK